MDLKQQYHRLRLKIRTSPYFKPIGFIFVVIIILAVIGALLIPGTSSFAKYDIDTCFSEYVDIGTDAFVAKDRIAISYIFSQHCYDSLDVSEEFDENNNKLTVFVHSKGLEDTCSCNTAVHGTFGPLDSGEYSLEIIKIVDEQRYTVYEKDLRIE